MKLQVLYESVDWEARVYKLLLIGMYRYYMLLD